MRWAIRLCAFGLNSAKPRLPVRRVHAEGLTVRVVAGLEMTHHQKLRMMPGVIVITKAHTPNVPAKRFRHELSFTYRAGKTVEEAPILAYSHGRNRAAATAYERNPGSRLDAPGLRGRGDRSVDFIQRIPIRRQNDDQGEERAEEQSLEDSVFSLHVICGFLLLRFGFRRTYQRQIKLRPSLPR